MMTIRKKNMAMLAQSLERSSPERLVKYVMARFPPIYGEDEDAAFALVDRVTTTAAEYGITKDEDLALFADLSVMFGEDFHRDPWAVEVLTSETMKPREKMIELRSRVHESGAFM